MKKQHVKEYKSITYYILIGSSYDNNYVNGDNLFQIPF